MPEAITNQNGTENHIMEVSESFTKSIDRETRLIEAETMLSLAISIIYPPDCDEEDDQTDLSFEIRYGLSHILIKAKEALQESQEAFCNCYEKQKYRDLFESGQIIKTTT